MESCEIPFLKRDNAVADLLNADAVLLNHVGDLIIIVAILTFTHTLLCFRTALLALFKHGSSVFQSSLRQQVL